MERDVEFFCTPNTNISDGDKICLHCYYIALLTEFLFIRYSEIKYGNIGKVKEKEEKGAKSRT